MRVSGLTEQREQKLQSRWLDVYMRRLCRKLRSRGED